MGECHLDDLLDILDEDEEDIEDNDDNNQTKVENGTSNSLETRTPSLEPEPEKVDPEKEALKRQLQMMEEQMALIKSQLGSNKDSGSLQEVDMFSSKSNIEDKRLRSPVKTNPLTEAERPVRLAKYEPRTTDWCPSLIKTSTSRVITGPEADQLKDKYNMNTAEMANIARADLADSDDEDLNAFGKDIKKKLSAQENSGVTLSSSVNSSKQRVAHCSEDRAKVTPVQKPVVPAGGIGGLSRQHKNIVVEKHSGLRISSPMVTQTDLDSAVRKRTVVSMSRISHGVATKQCDGDWVTFGVLYYKHPPKTSSSGNDFSTWKMTDMKGDSIVTVTLFLFGKAHKEHWKMSLNRVVGLLNPKIMDDKGGDMTISIDHPDKLMELGESVDLGSCAMVKQSGTKCSNIVNKAHGNYCVYHLKSAYKSHASARSSLQSSYSGGGGNEMTRARLMNKIAAKGETIFAGGQILNNAPVVVGKKSAASRAKDNQLLASLGGGVVTLEASKMVRSAVATGHYKGKPLGKLLSSEQKAVVADVSENVSEELGARLLAPTPGARMYLSTVVKEKEEEEKKKANLPPKTGKQLLLEHKQNLQFSSPKLGRGLSKDGEFSLDISPSLKKNYVNNSQAKALAILRMKGNKLAKTDPNNLHRSKNKDVKEKVMKRVRSEDDDSQGSDSENVSGNVAKRPKTVMVFGKEVNVEDLEAARKKTTANKNLVDDAELESVDKYFMKAEAKDAIEQKMLDTKSVKVKAVTCSICNYTDFKSSELCKQQGHKVKVIEASKRFFACRDCKRRTISLDRLPKKCCDKCGGSSWERVGMIAERKGPKLDHEMLSVRGNEETFLGSTRGAVNINI